MLASTEHARPTDLFNFQGIRKRVVLIPDYSANDERLRPLPVEQPTSTEYDELDLAAEQFEAYVNPITPLSDWIADRQHERREVDRLGDVLDYYRHKPHLNDFEKRVMKRLTRVHRGVQTDDEPEKPAKVTKNRRGTPVVRLPPSSAMERIEEFLATNRWRLVDLFRTLDLKKSWKVVKEDFMRLVAKEKLQMTEAEAEELLICICEEVHTPMNYKRFARGRVLYKKSLREGPDDPSQTTSTTEPAPPPPPPVDPSHHYPVRDTSSSYVRSTISSYAKFKGKPTA